MREQNDSYAKTKHRQNSGKRRQKKIKAHMNSIKNTNGHVMDHKRLKQMQNNMQYLEISGKLNWNSWSQRTFLIQGEE